MSERLTTRLPNGGVGYDNGEYFKVCYPRNEHCLTDIDRMAIKLCDLEDKIEQGDVVEVVRCKDCKHYNHLYECCKNSSGMRFVKLNGYCSHGERSEMENLNAEQIKYCLVQDIECGCGMYREVDVTDLKHALALINSQEQRIGELTEENERVREHNITLEQKLMLLGIGDVYVFKAKVKGETAND